MTLTLTAAAATSTADPADPADSVFVPLAVPELRAARAQLASLVDRLDAESLSGFDAASVVEEAAQLARFADGLKVLALPRVVETKAWADRGATSAARWLASTSGSSVGDAAKTLETAKQLEELPATRARVRAGRLSREQTREIADAATADPSAESSLLDVAGRLSLGELRGRCRDAKSAATPTSADEVYEKVRKARRLHTWVDGEGGFNIAGRTTVDQGALLHAILDPVADRLFREAYRAGRQEPSAAYRIDALIEALLNGTRADDDDEADETVDHHDDDGHDDGHDDGEPDAENDDDDAVDEIIDLREPTGDEPPGPTTSARPGARPAPEGRAADSRSAKRSRHRKPKRSRAGPATMGSRTKIIVRIDYASLVRGWVEGEEVCDIAGVGPIPVRVAREMLDDAFLAAIITKGVDVCTVAHFKRKANVFQHTALNWTDATCSTEGCPNTFRQETDHTEEWARTKHTTLTQLARPCGACHDKRTRKGYRYGPINPATGKRPLYPPNAPDASGSPD